MGPSFVDLSGKHFSCWSVLADAGRKGSPPRRYFSCICVCGVTRDVSGDVLTRGKSTSCGCARVALRTKHGYCGGERISEYTSWAGAKQRCLNSKVPSYNDYGGRGIKMCDEWLDSFATFIHDMGPKPKGTSLDRINNDGDYAPGNCRWATADVQAQNKRPRKKTKKKNEDKLS